MVGHHALARLPLGEVPVLRVQRGDGRSHHAWWHQDRETGFRGYDPMGNGHRLEDERNPLRLPAIRGGANHGFSWDFGCHRS